MALTREVSPAMNRCELTYLPRQPIDIALASEQHRGYEQCLRDLGVRVLSLPAEPELPDSVFVEDPLVVVDEAAVVTRPGVESRRGESESLASAMAPFRPLRRMREPATLEGGDVMRAGHSVFVGASARTNTAGIKQLGEELGTLGYMVRPVNLRGCMHLKTGCSYLGDRTVLVNREWIDTTPFDGLRLIDVPPEEPWGANVLAVEETLILPATYPATAAMLEGMGWKVVRVDIGEMMKAEGGVTCMSVVFEG